MRHWRQSSVCDELVEVGLLVGDHALAHEALDLVDVALGPLGMLEVHGAPSSI